MSLRALTRQTSSNRSLQASDLSRPAVFEIHSEKVLHQVLSASMSLSSSFLVSANNACTSANAAGTSVRLPFIHSAPIASVLDNKGIADDGI